LSIKKFFDHLFWINNPDLCHSQRPKGLSGIQELAAGISQKN
jgi:hypothetical protein